MPRQSVSKQKSLRRCRTHWVPILLRALLAIAIVLAVRSAAMASDGTWILNGNGNWSTASNWSSNPSIPNGQDQTATFGPTTALRTVTADQAFTVGNLVFNSGFGYALAGTSANP